MTVRNVLHVDGGIEIRLTDLAQTRFQYFHEKHASRREGVTQLEHSASASCKVDRRS
jgi:hypothetical protein